MKTVLLFSSIFYLLGLKMGNTIEILKRFIAPVKSIMHAPAPQPVKPEKSFFYKPDEISVEKKVIKKKTKVTNIVAAPSSSSQSNLPDKSTGKEVKVH
jgi:hypothetical protein